MSTIRNFSFGLVLVLAAAAALAQHPHPQPQLGPSTQTSAVVDGVLTTTVATGASVFPPSAPFLDPPGTNFLPSVFTNNFDSSGNEMPNTLPSTPTIPYNLHDGDPVISQINPISPTDDLRMIFDQCERIAAKPEDTAFDEAKIGRLIDLGIDILEGNEIPNRAYSGFPLLHYKGPEKVKKVEPILDATGNVVGGNVDVHQIWYDNHFESDTAFLDASAVQNVPWTVTYTVDVLSRGEDDFSPYVMYFDDPAIKAGMPNVGMDQSFFPMEDGTRTVLKIKMTLGKYFSLVYTWGWRWHPPRVQVTENANKVVGGKTTVEWETSVFGPAPSSSEKAKRAAIAKIGDLAPAKRMWKAFGDAKTALAAHDLAGVVAQMGLARRAFRDWQERSELPEGVEIDPASDITLFYVNNTIYAEFTDGGTIDFPEWQERGTTLKVALINGDFFDHAYMNVDFGGARGWENQFKSSVKVGGSGCWFTFGRNYWWMNLASMITLPALKPGGQPTMQRVHITYNYDPSRRLRFYQFDPTHHDVAVYSIH